jgi:hypothetical protein
MDHRRRGRWRRRLHFLARIAREACRAIALLCHVAKNRQEAAHAPVFARVWRAWNCGAFVRGGVDQVLEHRTIAFQELRASRPHGQQHGRTLGRAGAWHAGAQTLAACIVERRNHIGELINVFALTHHQREHAHDVGCCGHGKADGSHFQV